MKTITKLLLISALLITGVGGVNSVKARTSIDMSTATASANATWTSSTNTFAWTAENEYIVIPGLSGDLTGCYLDFTIGAACHIDIVDTDDHVKNGDWNGYGRFGSGGSKTQDLEFMVSGSDCDITKVKEVRICSQSASGNLTVTSVSYYFPLKLDYNSSGVATVPFYSIITSGGVTFDKSTGVVTNTDGTGYLAIELPNGGIDLSTVKRIDVTYTGDDDIWGDASNRILSSLEIPYVNTWQGSRYSCDYTSFSASSANVSAIKWNAGGKTGGSLTITSIKFTSEFVACAKAGETVLNTLPWIKISDGTSHTPAWNMGVSTDTYYGTSEGTNAVNYADLTAYEELRIYRDDNTGFRAFFIKSDGSGVNTIDANSSSTTWNSIDKYWSIDLSKVDKYNNMVALQSIKSASFNVTNTVNNIVVYKAPVAGSAQYLITGKGLLDAATTALLADATVTSIDATGMTNVTATTLTSANPNCLFIANTGKLSNSKNVIVGTTCANLELADGKPFKAPADFTATNATYNTTIQAAAGAGTLCLPFAATIPDGVKAYTLAYASGDKATATPVTGTISANTPVLLNGSGECTFTGSGAVSASASNESGALTGVFETGTVPANSYVLQKQGENVGFYKVTTDDIKIKPFRAYLTAPSNLSRISIVYEDEAAGIEGIDEQRTESKTVYDLQGRRVAQPTKGLYIVNGKLVIK